MPFSLQISYCVRSGSRRHHPVCPFLTDIDDDEHDQRNDENDRRQREKTRSYAYLDLAVNQCGYRIDSGASGEVCDDEIIDRHRETQQES